jgi:NADPH:quinone reductase-like Zn-dependent oxidoreductase
MHAIAMAWYGGPEVLELTAWPDRAPGPGEVRIQVVAAGVNPLDWKLRSGVLREQMPLSFPHVLGVDAAGTVVDVGADVRALAPGDRVCGLVSAAYAERLVAPAGRLVRIPDGLDVVEAAALPVVALTGAQLIESALDVRAGERVLVTGATGAVGRSAVFAALARGARVYAGVRQGYLADAAVLGVEAAVALDTPHALDGLPPLDAVADTVGGSLVEPLLARVRRGGRYATVVGAPPNAAERGVTTALVRVRPDAQRLAALAADVAAGRLRMPPVRSLPLAEAAEAHRIGERGGAGKLVLLP